MWAQYDAIAKESERPSDSTQTPIGSQDIGFSFDSIIKDVDVIVNNKIKIK